MAANIREKGSVSDLAPQSDSVHGTPTEGIAADPAVCHTEQGDIKGGALA